MPEIIGEYVDRLVTVELRNRGMPLEGLRYPITPTGMHYLLVHFDIPHVDAGAWRLEIAGLVSKPQSLTLDEIKRRPAVTIAVTMECAGNGRALLNPRPVSQPWLVEAVGTAVSTRESQVRGLARPISSFMVHPLRPDCVRSHL